MMKSPIFLIVEAEVRYWEDAIVNGVQDDDGSLIPFKEGGLWKPVIRLRDGQIIDWPQGTTADIHYKVCDEGKYWLATDDMRKAWKWRDHYVPDDLLSVGERGYGDYITLKVGPDGRIVGWQMPDLDAEQWEAVQ